MGITDIILLACYIPGVIRGILKGFVEQAVALFSILLGTWLACRFSARASGWLSAYITWKPELLRAATFVIIVILTILVLFVVGRLLTKIVKISTLGWLNRLLGILLGILVTTLVLAVAVTAVDAFNAHWTLIRPELLDGSPVWCALRAFASTVFPSIKALILTGHV
ncbi:MAG: CvpA family protein [Bacteroidales bacterium]|nr:CvpA family protein [Bacteroidales bacterium]